MWQKFYEREVGGGKEGGGGGGSAFCQALKIGFLNAPSKLPLW